MDPRIHVDFTKNRKPVLGALIPPSSEELKISEGISAEVDETLVLYAAAQQLLEGEGLLDCYEMRVFPSRKFSDAYLSKARHIRRYAEVYLPDKPTDAGFDPADTILRYVYDSNGERCLVTSGLVVCDGIVGWRYAFNAREYAQEMIRDLCLLTNHSLVFNMPTCLKCDFFRMELMRQFSGVSFIDVKSKAGQSNRATMSVCIGKK